MLSPRPVLEATAYLRTSRPVDVACSSGVWTRLPTMVILARGREGVVLKARAARGAATTARRARKDILVEMIDFLVWDESGGGGGESDGRKRLRGGRGTQWGICWL